MQARQPRRGAGNAVWVSERLSRAGPLLAFLVAVLCTSVPILIPSHLPLVDLPNHVARHVIAANPDGPMSAYYVSRFALLPNSSVDLFWELTGHPGGAERFSQIVLALQAAAMIGATLLLGRVMQGRWSVWPAAAGLLAFNGPFFWGFENYLVSMPFAIAGLALYLWTERWPLIWRCAVLVPVAAGLYLMHFFAFAALALAALGREVQRVVEAKPCYGRSLGHAALLAVPFLLPLGWLLHSIATGPPSPLGTRTEFGHLLQRFDVLLAVVQGRNVPDDLGLNLSGLAALLFLGGCLLRLARSAAPRLVLAPALRGPVIALALAALLAPTWLDGVALVHIRLAPVLAAVLLAGTAWQGLSQRSATALCLIAVTLLALHGVLFERFAARYSAEVAQLSILLEQVPRGSRLLPVRRAGEEQDRRLLHVEAYAVVLRDAFVPTLFQGTHSLEVREPWRDSVDPAGSAVDERRLLRNRPELRNGFFRYLDDWPRKFTHVLLLDGEPRYLDGLGNLYLVGREGRFALYRIKSGAACRNCP